MSNTASPCADLYAVVDLTKRKAKTENATLEIPVYHVLESTASNKDTEAEEKASNTNDMYSVVDLSKKSSAAKKKIVLCREKKVSMSDSDHQRKMKLFGKGITYNCLALFAFIAVLVSVCVTFFIMVILFSITYQKIITLEENFLELKKDFHNLNSSLDDTKTIIVNDAPAKTFYLYSTPFPSSCLETVKLYSNISDYYILRSSTGVLLSVYCDLNRTFGGNSTGWMRVTELDVNNCPPGMTTYTIMNSTNTCVVVQCTLGCTTIRYSVHGIQYTTISGRIQAYQIGSLDGFFSPDHESARSSNISSNYLDGVSITAGGHHIWSFAGGCTCKMTDRPAFIGDKYICDGIVYGEGNTDIHNFVWQYQQCHRNSSWFQSHFSPMTADIEVRICRDQDSSDENLAITSLELYIQ